MASSPMAACKAARAMLSTSGALPAPSGNAIGSTFSLIAAAIAASLKSGQYVSRFASSCDRTYSWRRLAASGWLRGDRRAGACGMPANIADSANVRSLAFFPK